MCMKDESCNQLMADMERKCNNVHTWNEYSMNNPTCSDSCFQAIFQLAQNPIGEMWSACDCRVPQKNDTYISLSKNNAFEEQCFQHKHNSRTFCYHKYSCKGKSEKHLCSFILSVLFSQLYYDYIINLNNCI